MASASAIINDLVKQTGEQLPSNDKEIQELVKRVCKPGHVNTNVFNSFTTPTQKYLKKAIKAIRSGSEVPFPPDILNPKKSKAAAEDDDSTSVDNNDPAYVAQVIGEMLPELMDCTNVITGYSVASLLEMLNGTNDSQPTVKIPYFQREFIWKPKEQEAFIESFLSDVPLHSLMMTIDPNKKNERNLVDGCQRLTTLKLFKEGETRFKGKKFSQLPQDLQSKFLYRVLGVTETITARKNWQPIFRRVNLISRPLNDIEMRRVTYDHRIFDDLMQIARKNEHWKQIFGNNKRYKGLHQLLRSVAMHLMYSEYKAPMTTFLDSFCNQLEALETAGTLDRMQITVHLDNTIMALSTVMEAGTFKLPDDGKIHASLIDTLLHGGLLVLENKPNITITELGNLLSKAKDTILTYPAVKESLTKNALEQDSVNTRMKVIEDVVNSLI